MLGRVPAAWSSAIDQHLRGRGWTRLPTEGKRLAGALRQATLVVLFRSPGVRGEEVREVLDQSLYGEGRLLQVQVDHAELGAELDGLPPALCLPVGADPDQAVDSLLRAVDRAVAALPPRVLFSGTPSIVRADLLEVDRKLQWKQLTEAALQPAHCALLVPGASDQGHDYFQARLHYLWPRRRARVYQITSDWQEEERLHGDLQRLFGAHDAATGLANALHAGDVVLLWPELYASSFHAPPLRDALFTWFPKLLGEAEAIGRLRIGHLRIVVNLSWPRFPAWAGYCALMLPPVLQFGPLERAGQRRRLLRQLATLQRSAGPLPVRCLPPLAPITEQDVVDHLAGLSPEEFKAFSQVARDATDSRHLLAMLQEAARRRDAASK